MSSMVNLELPFNAERFESRIPKLYSAGCILIALISVHDAVLLIVNHSTSNHFEQNPVGRWLLQAAGGEVWLFVAIKLLATSLVATALFAIYDWNPRKAWLVMTATAVFQLCLLWYLTFGE